MRTKTLYLLAADPELWSVVGDSVTAFQNTGDCLRAMGAALPDLLLLEVASPEGLQVLADVRRLFPELPVTVLVDQGEMDLAMRAMQMGASDIITKTDAEELERRFQGTLEPVQKQRDLPLQQERTLAAQIPMFIGQSEAMQTVLELVRLVAQSATTPVLIMGETGTGKELIARAIHYRSANSRGPLVSVNCAAIPSELIESELFGYTRGAFTGASASGKRGLIEAAADGTLFLDEIGDLSLSAQAKLLRFLENGEFYQVGGTHIVRVQTRVVSATNRDIEAFIAQGRFRADLYYRLGVVQLKVPSLNERREDILPLARHFLQEFSQSFGRPLEGITPDAEVALLAHRWLGNIRELKNCMERAVLVSRGPLVTKRDLWLYETEAQGTAPNFTELPPDGLDLMQRLEEIERTFLSLALQRARGNESQAARLLQLNHHTFRYKLRRMGLKP